MGVADAREPEPVALRQAPVEVEVLPHRRRASPPAPAAAAPAATPSDRWPGRPGRRSAPSAPAAPAPWPPVVGRRTEARSATLADPLVEAVREREIRVYAPRGRAERGHAGSDRRHGAAGRRVQRRRLGGRRR